MDLIRITVQRTKSRVGAKCRLHCQVGGNHHRNQPRSTSSHFCQHSERRPVSWVPIIDCIHRRGVRKNLERKGHHALHQWEILETDLCVWTRAFLLERRWRQGSHLGHAWKVTDATESLLTLCHGSWYSTWPEWRVCPCEEHRIWHRDHQTMHRTSSNHSQHSYWRHKRCSSWIGKHHWRNEPYEGFSPEKSMVRYPTRSIHPGAPDRCGWALGRSDRRFRTDVRRVQRFSSEWFPNEHMHGESHKMSELRKQLDEIGNLRNWSHWDGWIFTGCTSSCKVAQHLQRMCWLEKHGSRKGPSWILDHGNSCNALRIQNDQRRAQAGITSRCHPHARIHGEGKMQARPVATIHCATWNTNGGMWKWCTQNPMVLQTALGRWKRCLSWLHEDGINQGRDRINVQSNGDSWVHRRHFRILAWDAWPWHSISYNVWWMGGKPWQLPRRTGRIILALQQFMSTYRHHQHEAKSLQESIHSISRKWDGDSSSERGRNFQPTLAKEDHQNAGTPSSKLRWSSWDGWSFIKRWRDGRRWRAWRGDHVAYGARPSSGADFGRNWCRRWWHRSWGGWRGRGGSTLGGEEASNWGTEHPWSIWEVDCRCVECSVLLHLWWNAWHWWVLHTGWREHERHIMAHETDHGRKVKIPIFFRKVQSCDERQKRQAPEEHYATGETMEKNQIHWEGGSDQMLLQPASLHVRHWWPWRRRSIPSEWHRGQPLWPRCEKSSWAWCTCWTSSWRIPTCAADHWGAERMEPQRSWCICKMAHWRKKTVWRQLEFQVHPTIHTWPQHRYTATCSHQWRRISWLWMEWCETIWQKWVDGKEMGKPAMDGRTVEEIQCSATPLRGLRQGQSKSPWTTMRWSRLGQCRINIEVWQHLER